MITRVKNAEFVTSCTDVAGSRSQEPLAQFAFVGRSNVGKSSLLNMLTGRKSLAVTSSTPGRTRLINFFKLRLGVGEGEVSVHLVDLPGYGYAAAGKNITGGWNENIGGFLSGNELLRRVFVLLDVRHQPSELDVRMLNYLQGVGVPFSIIATKADKVSRSVAMGMLNSMVTFLGIGRDDIVLSSKDGQGRDKLLDIIAANSYNKR
ncbi:MAG: ribosome biogenesis GTP-binding protein YihA/YsxC [Firmicutes bacterium]|nr:ribosome biogenesis GTP-binding protein YihA/YsxC [Bacillota bacterium]